VLHENSCPLLKHISTYCLNIKRDIKKKRRPKTKQKSLIKMASKAIFFSFFVVSAVCLSSLAGFAAADADDFDRFQIQGSVYCDTCRVQFVTRLSKFLEGNIFTHVYLCFYTCMCAWLIYNVQPFLFKRIFSFNKKTYHFEMAIHACARKLSCMLEPRGCKHCHKINISVSKFE